MLRATDVIPAGHWPKGEQRDLVKLGFEDRYRRRRTFTASGGTQFLLDLADVRILNDGDGLKLENGGYVAVEALPEQLMEVEADTAGEFARLAWHLGNRHLPIQVGPNWIRLREDHVIADLLRRLGGRVKMMAAPFTPEAGAYGAVGDGHGYRHGHDHAAGHSHE
ncbi:MAG TPA: urease accessory protein UreE [Alphaproteobacteria bacterium]|nr:urease accessory protein UreE [Alphaproteobacteria bacterium]